MESEDHSRKLAMALIEHYGDLVPPFNLANEIIAIVRNGDSDEKIKLALVGKLADYASAMVDKRLNLPKIVAE